MIDDLCDFVFYVRKEVEEDGTENAGKYKSKVVKQEMKDIYTLFEFYNCNSRFAFTVFAQSKFKHISMLT